MSLRNQTILVIGCITLGIIVVLYGLARTILLSSFDELEQDYTRLQVQQVVGILQSDISQLDSTLVDWSAWNETCDFIAGQNDHYIEDNLSGDTLANLRLNVMLFYTPDGHFYYAKSMDLDTGEETPVPQSLLEHLSERNYLLRHNSEESSKAGILSLAGTPLLVASRPILDNDGRGPIRGTMIVGRYLDQSQVMLLADITKNPMTFVDLDQADLHGEFRQIRTRLKDDGLQIAANAIDADMIGGYALLEDVYGEAALVLKLEVPRDISRHGRAAFWYFLSGLFAASLIFGMTAFWFLEKKVLSRIGLLSTRVAQIATKGNLSERVDVPGGDEVSSLASEINEMLGALEHSEHSLRESEERYMLAVESANDGLWDWNLQANTLYFSPRWKEMLGYTDHEFENSQQAWFKLVHPADLDTLVAKFSAHLEGNLPHVEIEHRILHKDGSYRWVLLRGLVIRDAQGVAYRMAGSQSDITGRKLAEEHLRYDALHDQLTNLPNRSLFMEYLESALKRARRLNDYSFAVILLDFDRFKVINDSLGHRIGDELLRAASRRLSVCLRSSDTIARLGGDEFIILLEDVRDLDAAGGFAHCIQEQFKLPFVIDDRELFISASSGVVFADDSYEHAEEILRDAEIAMYRAKALGKAQFIVFDPTLRTDALTNLELETDLRQAVERGEFCLHYQPIISLATGEVSGFEALLRWQHPTRKMVPPSDFIPFAEQNGLIEVIGEWVLREACRQMREWRDEFSYLQDISVSVNLSGHQFSRFDLVEKIEQILRQTGLEPHSLKLEITESAFIENAESSLIVLHRLRRLGVRLEIDDFGTGYSSLGYLQNFPINTVKIDRSFVDQVDSNSNTAEIVRMIVHLAHDLGLDTVAEGVETEGQYRQLYRLGCKHGQGFYFSRPLTSKGVHNMLEKASRTGGLRIIIDSSLNITNTF